MRVSRWATTWPLFFLYLEATHTCPGQTQVAVTGTEIRNSSTYDSGTLTLTVNGYTKSVSYGQFSSPASLASGLAALFSRDCNAPAIALATGSMIKLAPRTKGASLGAVSGTANGQYNSFAISAPSGGSGGGGSPAANTTVTSVSLSQGPPQMGFVVYGHGFGSSQPSGSSVTVGSTNLLVMTWGGACTAHLSPGSDSCITVQVPAGAAPSGSAAIQVNIPGSNGTSNTQFQIVAPFTCPIQP